MVNRTQPRLLLAGLTLLLAWAYSQAAKPVLLKCPGQCAKYGVCNPELGRCDCLKNMTGLDCSTPLSKEELVHRCAQLLFVDTEECLSSRHSCLNACNNRGSCEAGFCLCKEGHYGADCSLSISPEGMPTLLYNSSWTLRKKRPWIYVYELPPRLTTWTNPRRLDRPTHHMFWQRLLSSGARTADPYQADWLYIPVRQRGMSDRQWLADAITYIDSTWPFWKEFGQHRHFMFNTADMGVDEADHDGLAMASNITWLTHWGLHTMHPFTKWRAAHRPGKDIVVPVFVSSGHYKHFGMERTPHHPAYDHSNNTRDKMFFFAGRICGHRGPPDDKEPWPRNCGKEEDRYSAGVRQAVHYFHHNRTGWQVALFERKYARALATTKYCLAPLGGGHGQRQVLAAFMGCIPVTIGDNVYQPFEPELPWSEFAVQVPESQVPQLHTILEAISDKKRAAMVRGLRCAAQHFLWSSIMGGIMLETGKYDAFETILEILRMKHQYPNADPKDYVKLDADFRRFAACGAEEQTQDPPAEPTKVCSHSVLEGLRPPSCYKCLIGSSPTHGYPGGVVCCGTKRYLGSCPRTWD